MAQAPLPRSAAVEAIKAVNAHGGNVLRASESLRINRGTLQARIRSAKLLYGLEPQPRELRATHTGIRNLLLLDIETAPHVVAVWGLWDNGGIPLDRLQNPGYTLCWSAKWYGEKEVMFDSILSGRRKMLVGIHKLMEQADGIVHYNGNKFDIPTLNGEFLKADMKPPAPSKQIDLLITAKRKFRLASNKLDFVAQHLEIPGKLKHKGFELWQQCMARDKEAFAQMEAYNKQDVLLLEKVYDRLMPWVSGHLNQSEDGKVCPRCGSDDIQAKGYVSTSASRFPRFQCNPCGGWFRGPRRVSTHTMREVAA
jgi:hypothetical protein